MPVANYFVKTSADGGNDGNAGTSWATAKATIQAGINLVTGTNKIIAVAPGFYNEAITTPSTAGASGEWNELVGDTNEIYTDAGANTHGIGIGPIINLKNGANSITWSTGTAYNYWRIRSMIFYTRGIFNGAAFTDTPDNFELYDIYAFGERRGLRIYFSNAATPTGTEAVKLFRCVGIGADYPGIQIESIYSSMPTGSIIELNSCLGKMIGEHNVAATNSMGIQIGGVGANQKIHATLNNCSGFAYAINGAGGKLSAGIWGGSTGNARATMTRCFGSGYYGIKNFDGSTTFTDCYAQGNYTNTETSANDTGVINLHYFNDPLYEMRDMNHYDPPPLLVANSGLADLLADFSGSLSGETLYDFFGRLLNQTPGAQEYVDGIEQAYAPPGYNHDDNGGRGILWTEDIINGGATISGSAIQHIVGGS